MVPNGFNVFSKFMVAMATLTLVVAGDKITRYQPKCSDRGGQVIDKKCVPYGGDWSAGGN